MTETYDNLRLLLNERIPNREVKETVVNVTRTGGKIKINVEKGDGELNLNSYDWYFVKNGESLRFKVQRYQAGGWLFIDVL